MPADIAALQTAFDSPLDDPPPDSYAAHVEELPKPGSRVFLGPNSLAVALIYNSMDPDARRQIENLREDVHALSDQNNNLNTYSQMLYNVALDLRQKIARLSEEKSQALLDLKQLRETQDAELKSHESACQELRKSLLDTNNALEESTHESALLKDKAQKLRAQLSDARTEAEQANTRVQSLLERHATASAEAGRLRIQLEDAARTAATAKVEVDELKIKLDSSCDASQKDAQALREELNAVRSTYESEIKALRAQVQTSRDSIAEMNNVKADRDNLASEGERLRASAAEAQKDAQDLREKLEASRAASDSKLKALKSQLKDSQNSAKEHLGRHASLVSEMERVKSERDSLTNYRDEHPRLVSDLDEAKAGVDVLRSQRDALQSQHDTIKGQLESTLEALKTARAEQDANKAELRKVKAERDRVATEGNGQQTELQRLRTEQELLRTQLQAVKSTESRLENERDTLKAGLDHAIEHWTSKYNDAVKQAEDWKAKYANASATIDAEVELRRDMEQRIKAERKKMHDEVSTLKSTAETYKHKFEEMTKLRDILQIEMSKRDTSANNANPAAQQQRQLVTERDSLREKVMKLEGERRTLRSKFEAANKTIAEKQQQLEKLLSRPPQHELDKEVELLKGERDAALGKVKTLEDQLAAGREGCDKIIDEYDESKRKVERLEFKLRDMTNNHVQTQRKIHELETELRAVYDAKAALQARVDGLHKTIQKERKRPGSQREVNEVRAENARLCAKIDAMEQAMSRT